MFAVWYTDKDSIQRIVGVSKNKSRAYKMARDLYSIKTKIDKLENISTGVSQLGDGVLYTSSVPRSAQVTPLLTSMN